MGEARLKALAAQDGGVGEDLPPQVVDTLRGRMHARWDEAASAAATAGL